MKKYKIIIVWKYKMKREFEVAKFVEGELELDTRMDGEKPYG